MHDATTWLTKTCNTHIAQCLSSKGNQAMKFSPNAGKCGKNADQNNSEYGLFLRSVIHLNGLQN